MPGLLSWILFLPCVGGLVLLFVRDGDEAGKKRVRLVSLAFSLASFALSSALYAAFRAGTAEMQFVESASWMPQFGIAYKLGVDGLSLPLVLLTTFLTPIAILFSWEDVERRVRLYHMAFLFLETGMIGVFVALDFFLFYVFWEAMLVPMYLIIGAWGGPRRIYAAVKFFLYTMAGGVLMLIAILWLYFATGGQTFDILAHLNRPVDPAFQGWLFAAFALSFAIKVPIFPFHTWLPDAHVEAPTAGSVILAGVLLKMGTYGFMRLAMPLFPSAAREFAPIVLTLAVVGIIYGALMAMVQSDVKKLVAYSSVSHLGFVMLGLFSFNLLGVSGGVLQMVNHGVSTGALFLIVGMLYSRRHTRQIADYGGIARVAPALSAFFVLTALSSIGLPGLNGFVGEFIILAGAFQRNPGFAAAGTLGVVLSAVYMLWMLQRVLFGSRLAPANESLRDLTPREWAVMVPMAFLMFWIGLYPKPLLQKIEPSAQAWLAQVGRRVLSVEAPVSGPPLGGVAAARREPLREGGRP
ncbi:MAG: NADH-quinone oxidoreductase subunit M [Nitrospinota bacterium]